MSESSILDRNRRKANQNHTKQFFNIVIVENTFKSNAFNTDWDGMARAVLE